MKKKGVLQLTLQLILFICHECEWTSCMSYKVVIHRILVQLIVFQLQLYQNNCLDTSYWHLWGIKICQK
jgi:hypothetical protein